MPIGACSRGYKLRSRESVSQLSECGGELEELYGNVSTRSFICGV
jgi:hypothetical protein